VGVGLGGVPEGTRRVLNGWNKTLKLSFDRRLIYHRPHSLNLFTPKFIEYILGKGNPLAVYREAEELSLWRTVEAESAR
jgi:hypothetical protein